MKALTIAMALIMSYGCSPKDKKPTSADLFTDYLQQSFGVNIDSVAGSNACYALIPDNTCKGCKSYAEWWAHDKENVTVITTPYSGVQGRGPRIWIDSSGQLNRLAITDKGTVLVTVNDGKVQEVKVLSPPLSPEFVQTAN